MATPSSNSSSPPGLGLRGPHRRPCALVLAEGFYQYYRLGEDLQRLRLQLQRLGTRPMAAVVKGGFHLAVHRTVSFSTLNLRVSYLSGQGQRPVVDLVQAKAWTARWAT